MPDSWYRVFTWWYYLMAVGSLGLFAVIPFVDAALHLRRASAWRLVARYAAIDVVLWTILLVRLRVVDDPAGVIATVLDLTWLFASVATAIVAGVRLTSLRRQIMAHLKNTAVLGIARPYSSNRATISDQIAADGSGTDCALLSVGLESPVPEWRDTEMLVRVRQALWRLLEDAFEASGIEWSSCLRYDAGDCLVMVVPRRIPKSLIVHPLLERLPASIRHHNRYADNVTQIRVRLAIHAGDIRVDDAGIIGQPSVLLARLIEAQPLKSALAEGPDTATVAVIVSESFYDDVIRRGDRGFDPEFYLPVLIRAQETEVRAWMHIPGHAHLR